MNKLNITIRPTENNLERGVVVLLEGELVLGQIKDVKNELLGAISQHDYLKIILLEVINVDLSFVQLLYAIRKSASLLGKQVSYDIDLPEDLRNLLANAGFNEVVNSFLYQD